VVKVYVTPYNHTMGLFDDSAKLLNMTFPWALGRWRAEGEERSTDPLAVYVDEGGSVNIGEKVVSYAELDPLDVPSPHTYSPTNNFITQLNRTLTTVPIGGIILYPTYNPRTTPTTPRRYWFAGIAPQYQGRVRYPDDTPAGFVPCVGQVLRYPDGSAFQVTEMAPPITSWGEWEGGRVNGRWGGSYAPGYNYLPPVRYLQRAPEGWEGDPVVEGTGSVYLDEVKPNVVWEALWKAAGAI
jgi:hypothetical protein